VETGERSFLGESMGLTPDNYTSRALEASAVVKTGDGVLFGFTVTNTKGSDQYVLVFDARGVPGSGAVPIFGQKVSAGDAVSGLWWPGRTFFAGIVLCNSSTQGSLTAGAADCLFDAQYL
jgi:hypothetical protein